MAVVFSVWFFSKIEDSRVCLFKISYIYIFEHPGRLYFEIWVKRKFIKRPYFLFICSMTDMLLSRDEGVSLRCYLHLFPKGIIRDNDEYYRWF